MVRPVIGTPSWGDDLNADLDAIEAKANLALTYNISGNGSPEGVVTASFGAQYTDLNWTSGVVTYIKYTPGVGNTGWQPLFGDTGWRNIKVSSGLTTSANTLGIRRTNNQVRLWCEQVERGAPYVSIFAVPVGFWSMSTTHHFLRDDTITGHWASWLTNGPDFMFINAISTSGAFTSASRFGGTISWITDQPWPAVNPGTGL